MPYEILKKINFLSSSDKPLKLQWLPSHIGLRCNEQADKLAKRAITDEIKKSQLNYFWEFKKLCQDKFRIYFDAKKKVKNKAYSLNYIKSIHLDTLVYLLWDNQKAYCYST